MIKQHKEFMDPLRDFMARDENEIDLLGKIVLVKNASAGKYGHKTLIAGPVLGIDWGKQKEQHEVWECEIIIKPIRKYKFKGMCGLRIDQFLVEALENTDNPEVFEKYFEKTKL